MSTIKWNKSQANYVTSKCGKYHLCPTRHGYGGLGKSKGGVAGYRIRLGGIAGPVIGTHYKSQSAAKAAAQYHANGNSI